MSFLLRICMTTVFVIGTLGGPTGIWLISGHAADFYKYLDHNGTLVFTEDLSTVPTELMDKVEKITLPGNRSGKTSDDNSDEGNVSSVLESVKNPEQLLSLGEKQVQKGKAALTSFLKDEIVLLSGYVITGIILFVFLSRLLKNLGGGLLKKIIFKMVFVTALFCGAYYWYLSYMNKNILNFGPGGTGRTGASSELTTPAEMLKKTQDIIDQVNARTKQKQELLDNLE